MAFFWGVLVLFVGVAFMWLLVYVFCIVEPYNSVVR